MRALRLNAMLATTAVALVLAASGTFPPSAEMDEDAIAAAIPLPDPANVPPPTAADVRTRSLTAVEVEAKVACPKSPYGHPPWLAYVGWSPTVSSSSKTATTETK